jgi:ADP-L-glycero-D-manno-heptose 6-epimerase
MNSNNNSNSPVVVTGAAGFIGARLAARLLNTVTPVIAVDEYSSIESRPEIASIYQDMAPKEIIKKDDFLGWLDSISGGQISGIIHMGACTDTTQYDEEFLDKVNTTYSRRLWDAAARLEIPFLYASSAAVYGDGAKGYNDETLPEAFSPLNPYGESKHRFDVWALGEGQKSQPPTWAGFRFFNVYGFGEAHKKRMASILYQAFLQILEQGEVRLFRSHKNGIADGHQSRDFVFVDDVVDVLAFAWQDGLPNGIYNLGTGQARTFLDLSNAAFAALDREPKIRFIDTPAEIRPKYQYFTEAKMEKLKRCGYICPFTSLEEGARRYWKSLECELAAKEK